MATADEIFAQAVAQDTSERPSEGHIVVGWDRYITVPDSLKRLGVQYDHNIETVTFDCPRYWDDHDMSKMHVYINYLRPDKKRGFCRADNVRVDETDENIMHFEWTITRNVTEAVGPIIFLVCVKKADAEGHEENHWNSERCDDTYISEGLEINPEDLTEILPDIVEQWYQEITNKVDAVTTKSTIKVDNAIAELTETVDNKTTELTTKVDSKIIELTETVDNKIAEVDDKTVALTTKVDEKIVELTQTVDNKSAELTQTVDAAIENLTNTVNDSVQKAEEAVETTTNKLLAAKEAGEFNGATFTPSVTEAGDLSWTNDKGLDNPATVNIKGARGNDGVSPTISVTTIANGHRITITDANGTKSIDLQNGVDGVTDTAAVIDFMKDYVVIGDTEPANGPALWFDTSAQRLIENIILLNLAQFSDEYHVAATIDETDYSVTNASEPTETEVDNAYEIQIT